MPAPTYTLRPTGASQERYLTAVARLADEVVAAGAVLGPILEGYGAWVEKTGREERRSRAEYLVEALVLGVLWRARGHEATALSHGRRGELVELLVGERRRGDPRRRDGSTALLLSPDFRHEPGRRDPSLADFERLLDWLWASGEYDDEVARLRGWGEYLDHAPSGQAMLSAVVAFGIEFEAVSERQLGIFSQGVERFVDQELPAREPREDTVHCSRRPVEYHLNMVGAELLNRAWREAFLACRRHLVVLPGCARARRERECAARRSVRELRCTHCTVGCSVSTATRVAARTASDAVAVVHNSDFSRFLRAPGLRSDALGIVGVACVPGLVGAGWRVRAAGFPAQCVLLEASGCAHWCDTPTPTTLDLAELERILERGAPAALALAPVA